MTPARHCHRLPPVTLSSGTGHRHGKPHALHGIHLCVSLQCEDSAFLVHALLISVPILPPYCSIKAVWGAAMALAPQDGQNPLDPMTAAAKYHAGRVFYIGRKLLCTCLSPV